MTAPLPPQDLHHRQPELIELVAGHVLHRFHTAIYDPVYYDRSQDGRFNAPDGSYGVLYTAKDIEAAFAETFLREPGRTMIDLGFLKTKAYAAFVLVRPLRLVKLAGRGLAHVAATAEVSHGGLPYDLPQSWSRALRNHPAAADGIAYTARHDDAALCCAIYDHAGEALEVQRTEADLDQDWFWSIAAQYRVGIAPGN